MAGTTVSAGATGPVIAAPTNARPAANLGASPSGFLAMCFQTCRSGPVRLSLTDQETCKLTCENAASIVDTALDAAPLWFSPTATTPTPMPPVTPATPPTPGVKTAPVGTPTATPGTNPPASKAAPPGNTCDAARDTCTGACEKTRASCERGCKQKNATDRETCKLDCGEGTDLCRADCTAEHATCANRR